MRLWRDKVVLLHDSTCAISGVMAGDDVNGKPAILDAHHVESRDTCKGLRYDALNGILLTKSHHKFGKDSAHKGMLWFAEWLRTNRPLQYAYILENRDRELNLNSREVLYEIESKLKAPPTEEEFRVLGVKQEII